MDNVSVLLSSVVGIAMVLLIAPSVFRMNRGRVLRNIALWLVIVAGLALVYRTFGPFETAATRRMTQAASSSIVSESRETTTPDQGGQKADDSPKSVDDGRTPDGYDPDKL